MSMLGTAPPGPPVPSNTESIKREMLEKFILNANNPKTVPPKPRAARGSRKRREQISLTRTDLEHMLKLARQTGAHDMIQKLTPKRDLKGIKRELISCIRKNTVNQDLWDSFVEVITSFESETETINKTTPYTTN